ncbi:MAG: phosphoglycerate kinase [Candidatus Westeberhardia cardiocondylae]|nr:phosphoglycerate kinase [Candidatus Westeberhardia cardiocondylae]
MKIQHMKNLNLSNKKILIRSDLNVPITPNGKIISDIRIRYALPTINMALQQKAKVMVTSHLGSPEEGIYNAHYSLKPIVQWLKHNISNKYTIHFKKNYLNEPLQLNNGELTILENVRFNKGEKNNTLSLSKKYASLCDIFIMDAFGAAHRKHSSTYGIIKFAPISCIGPLLYKEIKNLHQITKNPKKPIIAIIGGAKISTKLNILHFLSNIVDKLIVGGGIANTMLAAKGYNIGKSLQEIDAIKEAKKLIKKNNIITPIDVIVNNENEKQDKKITQKFIHDIQDYEKILDIGKHSITQITNIIKHAKTIIWNGPIGAFELEKFQEGTKKLCQAIATSNAFSIVGGGDTIAAVEKFKISEKISYISTGGGAFLKFLTKGTLPAIQAIKNTTQKYNTSMI